MGNTTQLKLAHKLTDAVTSLVEKAECIHMAEHSPSLGAVLSIETVCCQYLRSNERTLDSVSSSGYGQHVSNLAFRIFLLLSTRLSSEEDPILLIPKLKQVIHATLSRYLRD